MEVNNRSMISKYMVPDQATSPIKVGDIIPVMIKERSGNNVAKVLLKGQELTVSFDGQLPAEDRASVQVTNQSENGQFTVKPLSTPIVSTSTQTVDDVLRKFGFDPGVNPGLKEATTKILSGGGNISKDSLENIQDFLKNDTGSITEKLKTIKVMEQKNLEFTQQQLHSVNVALNGTSLTDTLTNLVGGPIEISAIQESKSQSALEQAIAQVNSGSDQSNILEKVLASLDPVKDVQTIADIKKALQIQQAGNERILQALPESDIKEAVQKETNFAQIIQILKTQHLPQNVEAAIKDALKLEKIGAARLEAALKGITDGETPEDPSSSAIKEMINLIQKEPSLANVLDGIQRLLEADSSTNIDLSGLKSALEKATQLSGQGRELAARKELALAVQHLQENNPSLQIAADDTNISKAEQYFINEAIQSLQLDSKNILVTQITKKLSQLAIDFKQMRQEISRNLDSATRLMEANKQGSAVLAKQILESAINKLDQSILKSDILLYTDMSTEKKLLTASSRLAEARSLLSKGNVVEANQIVKEVKNSVDQLMFKPSDSRVKHFVSEQDLLSPKAMLEKAIRPFPDQTSGARSVFETVKGLGLTHEADSAKALIHKEEPPANVKSLLLQLLETNDGQSKQPVEQALSAITGQQLLNKPDSSGVQNLFMQLPILLNKQVENVKVYVNSQKKGEKIDWENCNLTFLLETKKLGEVGIAISVVNRNLSITFKNNKEELQAAIKPLTEVTKDHLEEIGYHVGGIQFKPLIEDNASEKAKAEKSTPITAAFTEKGYDFTI
ncbi:hypothetical protein [Bacillus sp. EB600]|uniref:hypothetical protein n=1 Tax=Bacillus sp. EB600 TaxID=2806345 RepID=UPI00210CAC39|nr:hypothetical protein [Bacillus sp. EB600]MCQ6278700.1 hypothetical protein [Bacillus sp. EB600]